MVSGVEYISVTTSRNPIQTDGGKGCYPRVRREHRQAVTLGVSTGSEHVGSVGSRVVGSVHAVARGFGKIGGDRSKATLR